MFCDFCCLQPGTEPYIKIKAVAAGKWLQRLLFINPEEQITAESDECFLLRDKKRQGCEALEFTDNVSNNIIIIYMSIMSWYDNWLKPLQLNH